MFFSLKKDEKFEKSFSRMASIFAAIILLLLLLLLLLLFTAMDFALGGSSPYTSKK